MTPSDIIAAGEQLYGQKWRKPLADALGVDVSTLRRWTSADTAIPRRTALAIQALLEKKQSGH
jgi:hypothetical protein